MKTMRMLAIPGLILAGALVVTGCGDKDTPATSPSPSDSAMMNDDDMMSSPTSPSDAMMEDEDDMMSPTPSP